VVWQRIRHAEEEGLFACNNLEVGIVDDTESRVGSEHLAYVVMQRDYVCRLAERQDRLEPAQQFHTERNQCHYQLSEPRLQPARPGPQHILGGQGTHSEARNRSAGRLGRKK
jgi:hypothetical protein